MNDIEEQAERVADGYISLRQRHEKLREALVRIAGAITEYIEGNPDCDPIVDDMHDWVKAAIAADEQAAKLNVRAVP